MPGTDSVVIKFDFTPSEKFAKSGDGSRVYGWLSVTDLDGEMVVDTQGDVIKQAEIVRAAENFMKDTRVAKVMHEGVQKGEFVQSLVFTDEVVQAFKDEGVLTGDFTKRGWFGVMEVTCPETRKLVKAGKLKAFSIGGEGVRTEISEAA